VVAELIVWLFWNAMGYAKSCPDCYECPMNLPGRAKRAQNECGFVCLGTGEKCADW